MSMTSPKSSPAAVSCRCFQVPKPTNSAVSSVKATSVRSLAGRSPAQSFCVANCLTSLSQDSVPHSNVAKMSRSSSVIGRTVISYGVCQSSLASAYPAERRAVR